LHLENHSKTCVRTTVCSPTATKPHSIFGSFYRIFLQPSLKEKTLCICTLPSSKPFPMCTKNLKQNNIQLYIMSHYSAITRDTTLLQAGSDSTDYLHLAAEVCTSCISIILQLVQKLFDHTM
jgi:hypothetical protein